MNHYMVYWREYWINQKQGYGVAAAWSSNSEMMHRKVRAGDWIWVVIRDEDQRSEEWKLIARILVKHVPPNPSESPWGNWHFAGDAENSIRYATIGQPDFTPQLLQLDFASGKRIKAAGRDIGKALQSHGHRKLATSDAILLDNYAKRLTRERFDP